MKQLVQKLQNVKCCKWNSSLNHKEHQTPRRCRRPTQRTDTGRASIASRGKNIQTVKYTLNFELWFDSNGNFRFAGPYNTSRGKNYVLWYSDQQV